MSRIAHAPGAFIAVLLAMALLLCVSGQPLLGGTDDAAVSRDSADPGDAIEQLLDQLSQAENESEASRIERLIVDAWQQSGSATVDLLMQRAGAALQDQDYALAIEYLDTVVELAPSYAEGWNRRATVYFEIDAFQRSIDDISRVLGLQPRHFGALSGLGLIFRELDDKPRALSALRRALEVHPHLGTIRRTADQLAVEVEGRGI
jgi:tetratricopeptide (TPR) repeat protein